MFIEKDFSIFICLLYILYVLYKCFYVMQIVFVIKLESICVQYMYIHNIQSASNSFRNINTRHFSASLWRIIETCNANSQK